VVPNAAALDIRVVPVRLVVVVGPDGASDGTNEPDAAEAFEEEVEDLAVLVHERLVDGHCDLVRVRAPFDQGREFTVRQHGWYGGTYRLLPRQCKGAPLPA